MEYQEAENLVFSSAVAGTKNILADLAVVIIALISILLVVAAIDWLRGIFFQRGTSDLKDIKNKKKIIHESEGNTKC